MLPIAAEGWGFILVPLALAALLAWTGWTKVALLLGVVAAFMTFFFRDPDRVAPETPGAILAPADGRVVDVRTAVDDPFVGAAQAVSIFLSPLDVHVNRSPLAGLVVGVEYAVLSKFGGNSFGVPIGYALELMSGPRKKAR